MQTVLGVVRDRSMLRQAASDANVALTPAYTLDATVQPGSTLIESTVDGPDRSTVDRLATAYARSASNYVAASYSAYVLERLSSGSGSGGGGPGGLQVAILALLVGSALGVALVAAELRFEPQLRRFLGGVETERRARRAAKPRPRPQSNGKPEHEPDPARTERAAPLGHRRAAAAHRSAPRRRAQAAATAAPRQRQEAHPARRPDAPQGQGLRCTTRG